MNTSKDNIIYIDGIPIRKDSMYYEVYSKGKSQALTQVMKIINEFARATIFSYNSKEEKKVCNKFCKQFNIFKIKLEKQK